MATAYLSFNENLNSNLKFTSEEGDSEVTEETLKKELLLRYKWVFWNQIVQKSEKAADRAANSKTKEEYSNATQQLSSFASVQDFWALWTHMPQPSELLEQKRMSSGADTVDALMIFRENVRPEWEDELNATGGHFQFQLKPSVGGGQIDEYWNNLVLGVIGSTIEPACMITGIRLVDKLSGPRAAGVIRLEVWFSNYDDTPAVNALRRSVEQSLATRLDGSVGQVLKCETKSHGKH